jgi:xanthine dehydrogenase YagT iron-sulfur-binding subunit
VLLHVSPRAIVRLAADDPPRSLALARRGPRDGDRHDEARLRAHLGIPRDAAIAIAIVDGQRTIRARHLVPRDPSGRPSVPPSMLLAALRETAERMRATTMREPLRLGRREMLVTTLVTVFAAAFASACAHENAPPPPKAPPPLSPTGRNVQPGEETLSILLNVNGSPHPLVIEARASLLDVLREQLGLTGTKKGCDMGQCGACTVLVEGRRVLSCLTLAATVGQGRITTIEGLGSGAALHPMQRAFLAHDAFQCGFCTPGQIMSAIGMLAESHPVADDEIADAMSGNVCRCGAYTNIVAAIIAARRAV